LWVEQPLYTQVMFALDRVKATAPKHPEWKDKEPFKSILKGNLKALTASGEKGVAEVVFATHAGDDGPIDLRVPGSEVAELLPVHLVDTEDLMTGDDLPMCGAGHDFASITPHGLVYPCLSMRLPMGNIRERSFTDIWRNPTDPLLSDVRAATWGDLPTCSSCEGRAVCDRCPGLAYHEGGDVLGPSEVHCEHAFARLDELKASPS